MNLFNLFEGQEQYILYFNGKPAAKFDNPHDAQRQVHTVKAKYPDTKAELRKEVCTLTPVELEENFDQGMKEARLITKPEDGLMAIKKFAAYVQKNIVDLTSNAGFEIEHTKKPYVDKRFTGFLTRADGTPVTPIFNLGGKLTLVGPNKNYLNIPTELYYSYRGIMGGGALVNHLKDVLGYKNQGVAEGAEFGSIYAEQLAQQTFDIKPDLKDENEVLNLGYSIAVRELGPRARGFFRDEDFPSDFVSAYGWLQDQKQGMAETNVSKYKDLGATKDTTHFIKNIKTGEVVSPHRSLQDAEDSLVAYGRDGKGGDYKIVRARKQGVAEADQLPGTPVVSLKDLDSKDTKKNRYGRTVPKKLEKDDPRVKFHPDYSKHEKKLISKMSNAEKADKGWRNPNMVKETGEWPFNEQRVGPVTPVLSTQSVRTYPPQQVYTPGTQQQKPQSTQQPYGGPKPAAIIDIRNQPISEGISGLDLADAIFKALEQMDGNVVRQFGHEVVGNAIMDVVDEYGEINNMSDLQLAVEDVLDKLQNVNEDSIDKGNFDPELEKAYSYARAHYPELKDPQQAFNKFMQRSQMHGLEADQRQDRRISDLENKVNQLVAKTDMREHRHYFKTVGTNTSELRNKFGLRKDHNGWFLSESHTNFKKLYLEATRTFTEYDLSKHTVSADTIGDDNFVSPVGSVPRAQQKKAKKNG